MPNALLRGSFGVVKFLLAALIAFGAVACNQHEIVRTRWFELSGYKPGVNRLIEVESGGQFYVTPRMRLSFVDRSGREITREWQEITLAKNTFTAISVKRETFTFPLSNIARIVAHGKLAGELTGVVTDRSQPPPSGMGAMGRPMF